MILWEPFVYMMELTVIVQIMLIESVSLTAR